ncbi:hypothetical protein STEG23_028008 [Scotinomys teguina]
MKIVFELSSAYHSIGLEPQRTIKVQTHTYRAFGAAPESTVSVFAVYSSVLPGVCVVTVITGDLCGTLVFCPLLLFLLDYLPPLVYSFSLLTFILIYMLQSGEFSSVAEGFGDPTTKLIAPYIHHYQFGETEINFPFSRTDEPSIIHEVLQLK